MRDGTGLFGRTESSGFDLATVPGLSGADGAGFDFGFGATVSVDPARVSAGGLILRPFCFGGSGAAGWAGAAEIAGLGGSGGAVRCAVEGGGAVPTQLEKRSSGSMRCSMTVRGNWRGESRTASVTSMEGPGGSSRAAATLATAVRTDWSNAVAGAAGGRGLSGVSSMVPGLARFGAAGGAADGRMGSEASGAGSEEAASMASKSLEAQTMR